ncbi:MAG: type II toxin-antitoxin system PemK/MazF family toxin [Thermodesulfobacteriota bacterium]|nr:type II toxin-antitoxin system PemK/MazF family toxin [Thermodesulfobacteriota bacterium]
MACHGVFHLLNKSNINTTIIALLTSNRRLASMPGNIQLKKGIANLPKTSVVVVSQMAIVDKLRLLEKIGTLNKEKTEEVIKGCREVISLKIFS